MSGRPGGTVPEWTGVVLAGGRSTRFGGVDKTRLPLGGRTLLQRAIDVLAPHTATTLVVGSHQAPCAVVPDRHPGAGPLGGILTALEVVQTAHLICLAADLPFMSGAVLRDLQRAGADAPAAFLQHPDGSLALCLAMRRECVEPLREAWARGARRVRDLADLVACVRVPVEPVTAASALWNVNDPLTYARALEMTEHDCPAC